MLHKLALATRDDTMLQKEALISPAKDQRIKERLERKAIDMANARGIEVPLVSNYTLDPITEQPVKGLAPSTETLRTSGKTPTPGHSALIEKEIQKAHGTVSNSPLKPLRHQTVGKAQRAWGGKGLLGGKWKNRAAIAGGLGALGLGVKSYFDANEEPPPPLPRYPSPAREAYSGYPKMGSSKYSPDAVVIPKPTPQPKIAPLGPSVSSTPAISSGSSAPKGLLGGSSSPSSSGGSSESKSAEDAGVMPLLGVGAGGLGGWALGEKVIAPMIENKEKNIASEIARKQQMLQNYQKVRKAAPIGAAAAGALLLAALTAMYARKSQQPVRPVQASPYDQTGAGFSPQEQNQWGNFYG